MPSRRSFVKAGALTGSAAIMGSAGCLGALSDSGGEYPSEPISTIVPFSPGGSTDIFTRQIMPPVAEELGIESEIENISGAFGLRGAGEAFRADPDGYTQVGLNPPYEMIAALVQNPDIDLREFEPVGQYTVTSWVLIANAENEITDYESLKEAYDDGTFNNIGSVGQGTQGHIINEVIKEAHDIGWEELVVYDGSGPASQAVLSGEVPVVPVTAPSAEAVAGENIEVIASFSSTGTEVFPDAKSVTEFGYDSMDYVGEQSKGYWMPPDTDEERITEMTEALETVLNSEELQSWSEETGNSVGYAPPEEAHDALVSAFEKIPEVVNMENIK